MKARVQPKDLWSRTGNAVAWVASFYLRYKAIELLFYPRFILAPMAAIELPALFIPGAVMTLLFIAALVLRKFPPAPTPFFGIALFAFASIWALYQEGSAEPPALLGFGILLIYGLVHGLLSVRQKPILPESLRQPVPTKRLAAFKTRGWTIALFVVFALALILHAYWNGSYLYAKARVLFSPTFDHGIFVQSMEGILRTGLPVTTLERGRELSHFAVHFSPVLYLMVPFYAMFRTPWALNVLQLLPVLLALLPLFGVLRLKKLPRPLILFFLTLYVLSPAQIFSSHYDFHENIFLGLGIFTLWYFWEKRTLVGTILGTLLVLGVKEDAFVYVFAFMLWQLFENFQKRDTKRLGLAFGLLVFSLVYFAVVTSLMARYGTGTMESSRFMNLLPPGTAGFVELIKVIVTRPGFVLTEIFKADKMRYLVLVLGITGFAPLWTRRYALNFLLIPLVLVNVLSNWPYQYDISFQYHYGTSALLLIMLVATVAGLLSRRPSRFTVLCVAVILVFALLFAAVHTLPRLHASKVRAKSYLMTEQKQADEILDYVRKLPPEDTYLVNTFLGAAFYRHPKVYELDNLEVDNFDFKKIDCIVLDARYELSLEERERLEYLVNVYGFEPETAFAPVLVYRK